jgi:hypothetical protein
MGDLAYMVDKRDPNKEACLARDANAYEPLRDGVAHTALLTDDAKLQLSSVYANIKARIYNLLTSGSTEEESGKSAGANAEDNTKGSS